MEALAESIELHPVSRKLLLHLDKASGPQDAIEISTVYFRAGYGPADYIHSSNFEVRYLLERSSAIKCPSIALQLAGSKKVQQVLTQPGVVERYLCDKEKWGPETFGKEEIDELRASWMEMWGLDEDVVGVDGAAPGEGETAGVRKARESAASLVLKPQREGGGNNIYKNAIPGFLDGLSAEERPGWIAMKVIDVPTGLKNFLVRADRDDGGRPAEVEVASELGIFGWALFGSGESITEKEAGWLLRTKGKENDEGGVAAGFSVLDSLVLVDG
jgi:glutathione synthetase